MSSEANTPPETRKEYYDKWASKASEMEAKITEEQEKIKQQEEKQSHQQPRSAAEKADKQASARLRAKKEAMDKIRGEVEHTRACTYALHEHAFALAIYCGFICNSCL